MADETDGDIRLEGDETPALDGVRTYHLAVLSRGSPGGAHYLVKLVSGPHSNGGGPLTPGTNLTLTASQYEAIRKYQGRTNLDNDPDLKGKAMKQDLWDRLRAYDLAALETIVSESSSGAE